MGELQQPQHSTPQRGREDDTRASIEGWVIRAITVIVILVVAGLVLIDLVRTAG